MAASKALVERLTADKKLAEADEAIAAMIKSIEAEPREEVASKFGQFGDDSAIAAVKAQYLPIAEVLAEQGDLAEAKRHVQMAADAVTHAQSAGLVKWPQIAGVVMTTEDRRLGWCPHDAGESAGQRRPVVRGRQVGDAVPTRATCRRRSKLPVRLRRERVSDRASARRRQPFIGPGEVDAATKLLEGVDDLSERARAYAAAGRTMIEAGGGRQLADWIDASQSDIASTFACLGAAEALSQENVE